jgi:phenylalanyl-tRNA synthetase beta chain
MKVSRKWLSEYIGIDEYTGAQLADMLTRAGIEVDVVENRNKGVSDNVVVGFVKQCEKHPDADKLRVCVVDAGQGEDLQIVCGAQNVAAGQKVPVALPGSTLPDGVRIKKAKLRGVESNGMICSAKELGLNDRLLPKEVQSGILVLPADAEVGRPVAELLDINDEVLELDLTPNRSDCLSMIGTAYEVGAITGRSVRLPEAKVPAGQRGGTNPVRVRIEAPEHCRLFTARYIDNVVVGPSPQWMQNRLMAAGVRPINNIVDITNYVMLEYGQPLHAYDAARVKDAAIRVRLAEEGERLRTLDGVERTLEPHMLVIADPSGPIGLAGVMGGENTEVSDATRAVILEAACFEGSTVRRTSRQLGLRSEASLRFEKGINPDGVIPALDRAAALIAEYAGGVVAEEIALDRAGDEAPRVIELSVERVNQYLGMDLPVQEVAGIFDRLQFSWMELKPGVLSVGVPKRRGDITLDVDLIEEVARLIGYDRIPVTPIQGATTPGGLTREQKLRRMIRHVLTQSGLHETVSYSLVHPGQIGEYEGLYAGARPIPLAMPMSEERSVLRTSLVPGLLETAQYNRNRHENDLAVFEIGSVFLMSPEDASGGEAKALSGRPVLTRLPQEKPQLAVLMTGARHARHWGRSAEKVDFYDLKGVAETLFEYLGMGDVRFRAAELKGLHPGRGAEIIREGEDGPITLGRIGQLHPDLQKEKDLDDTYILELELEPVYRLANPVISYVPAPKYPSISRDIAVVVDERVPVADMLAAVRMTSGDLLEASSVFDVYQGDKVGAGQKSIALSLVYRHPERTLTDEEVAVLHEKVVERLESEFGAKLRMA